MGVQLSFREDDPVVEILSGVWMSLRKDDHIRAIRRNIWRSKSISKWILRPDMHFFAIFKHAPHMLLFLVLYLARDYASVVVS